MPKRANGGKRRPTLPCRTIPWPIPVFAAAAASIWNDAAAAAATEKPDPLIFAEEWMALWKSRCGERGIFNREAAIKQVKSTGRRDPNYEWGTNPCSEILLRPNECCNLTEVVIRADDTPEAIEEKIILATILGTMQATLTNFQWLDEDFKRNCEEEALLGVSLTGIMDGQVTRFPTATLASLLEKWRQTAIDTNRYWAGRLGIRPAASITCVKPSYAFPNRLA